MKWNKFLTAIMLTVVMLAALTSCEKDKLDKLVRTELFDPTTSSNLRLVHVFPWLTPAVATLNPALASGQHFFFYRDTFKLTGSPISYGGYWPASSSYSLQPAGSFDFRLVLARQASVSGVVIPKPNAGDTFLTKKLTLEAGKFYSAFICDTTNKDLWVIEDKISTLPDTSFGIRFAHLLINNKDTLSVFSRRENRIIISDMTYKTASEFVRIKVRIVSDTFDIIRKGPGANPFTTSGTSKNDYVTNILGTAGRYYTIIGRGNSRVVGRGASLGFYTNR